MQMECKGITAVLSFAFSPGRRPVARRVCGTPLPRVEGQAAPLRQIRPTHLAHPNLSVRRSAANRLPTLTAACSGA